MQQTEKYKLNLIEPSDPFLPDGLNENTRKLEQVVSGHLEGMEGRVAAIEAHKLAMGNYSGTYTHGGSLPSEQFISIGFCPTFVMVWRSGGSSDEVFFAYLPEAGVQKVNLRSGEDGFYVREIANLGGNYQFLAFR